MGDQVGNGGVLSETLSRWRIRKALPYLNGKLLDFGCGRGNLADFIGGGQYLGVDQDPLSLEVAARLHPKHTFSPSLPAGERFDSIAALAVLEHLTHPEGTLRQLASLLAPSGAIVVTTPHPASEKVHKVGARVGLFSADAEAEHSRLFDRNEWCFTTEKAGLRLIRYERFMLGMNQLIIMKR